MFPLIDTDTLLFELDQRRRQAAMWRAAREDHRKPAEAHQVSSPAAGRRSEGCPAAASNALSEQPSQACG